MTSQSNRHVTLQARGYLRKKGYLPLGAVLTQCAILYNAALQERRDAHRMSGLFHDEEFAEQRLQACRSSANRNRSRMSRLKQKAARRALHNKWGLAA